MKKIGAYLPGAYEEVVDVVDAYVLTEKVSCKAMSSIIIIDSQRKLPTSCNSTESMTSEKRLLKFRTGDMSLNPDLDCAFPCCTASEIFLNQSEAPFAWNKALSDF